MATTSLGQTQKQTTGIGAKGFALKSVNFHHLMPFSADDAKEMLLCSLRVEKQSREAQRFKKQKRDWDAPLRLGE